MAKKQNTLQIQVPRWAQPLLAPKRYKGAWGGRGGGKSEFFAELMIAQMIGDPNLKCAGIREIQKSIQFSIKEMLVEKIKKFNAERYFDIQDKVIKRNKMPGEKSGDGIVIFQGLQSHNADSIKSLTGFHRFFAEEASSLSKMSLRKLRPTLRASGSEFWAAWNPESPEDAIDEFLRNPDVKDDPDFCVVRCLWNDNPWFPAELELERQIDLKRNPDDYAWIWEGEYLTRSDAQVFQNWKVEEFETPDDAKFYYGADFGFKDPATLVRLFIEGRKIYIDYEAFKVKCSIEDLPKLFDTIPDAKRHEIRADSSRPDTIDFLRRNGFPRIVPCTKGPNSVKEGVEFIQSYDVIIHPRCKNTQREFARYKYKVDKDENILNEFEDKENHIIDPVRYALEIIRKKARHSGSLSTFGPKILDDTPTTTNSSALFLGPRVFEDYSSEW